jgi:hypothetical protein
VKRSHGGATLAGLLSGKPRRGGGGQRRRGQRAATTARQMEGPRLVKMVAWIIAVCGLIIFLPALGYDGGIIAKIRFFVLFPHMGLLSQFQNLTGFLFSPRY